MTAEKRAPRTKAGTGGGARKWVVWVAVGVAALLVIGVVAALVLTSRPGFYAKYARLKRYDATLQVSAHRSLKCGDCHRDDRTPLVGYAARVGDFYRGIVKRPKEPMFIQIESPMSEACRSCHLYDWSDNAKRTGKVPHPAHLRVADEPRECVKCHKWTAHEEPYMQKHKQMPFSTVCASFGCHVGWKTTDQCGSCHHSLQEGKGEWKQVHRATVRQFGPNGCLESCHTGDQCRQCHTTGKRPAFTGGGVSGVTAIEREHVKKDWMSKHGSFAMADQSKCLVCHVSEAECKDCHSKRPAFHGSPDSWLGRHKNFAKKNEKRCLACHEQKWCDACHKQFKEMR